MNQAARLILLLPLLFLALFFIWPLLSILTLGLAPDGQPELARLQQIVSPYHLNTLIFTCVQALLSTALTITLALPAAWVCVRWSFPGRSLLLSLSTLAFVLPTVVVAAAFSALIGSRGLLNSLLQDVLSLEAPPLRLEGTLAIILLAHIFYNFAVALRIITGYWANRNVEIEEAARVLGAHGWRLWWELRLPLLRPALLAAAVLIFIFTFTSFGVIIILGELRFATLEVEIYLQAVNLFNLPVAAGLSLLQIGLMLALMLVYTRLRRRLPQTLQPASARRPQGAREWLAVALVSGFMFLLLAAPMFALVLRSLSGAEGLTMAWYAASVAECARLGALRGALARSRQLSGLRAGDNRAGAHTGPACRYPVAATGSPLARSAFHVAIWRRARSRLDSDSSSRWTNRRWTCAPHRC